MNNNLMVNLRELLVVMMHNRTLREKATDALHYCRESVIEHEISISVYGEYCDLIEQLIFLVDKEQRIAPDDLLRSGGDLLFSILLLYEKLAAEAGVNEYIQQKNIYYD